MALLQHRWQLFPEKEDVAVVEEEAFEEEPNYEVVDDSSLQFAHSGCADY